MPTRKSKSAETADKKSAAILDWDVPGSLIPTIDHLTLPPAAGDLGRGADRRAALRE
jgi:hypothetical protein